MTYCICICTFKRPQKLKELLNKLHIFINHIEVKIIVVDNDQVPSAKVVCDEFPEVVYLHEIEPGVAAARNRALHFALSKPTEFILFIDDDEIISEYWFENMVNCQKRFDADIIAGPVESVFSDNTQNLKYFFSRPNYPTGTIIKYWGAGNVMLRRSVVEKIGRFNEILPGYGGEDTDYSSRCTKNGISALWCAEAKVYEHTDKERANFKWIMRRSYNSGFIITYVELSNNTSSITSRLLAAIFNFLRAPVQSLLFIIRKDTRSIFMYPSAFYLFRSLGILGSIVKYIRLYTDRLVLFKGKAAD